MNFSFDNKKIRKICENSEAAKKALGAGVAAALQSRIADIDAAVTFADVVAGNPRVDPNSNGEVFILDLSDKYHLKFKDNYPKMSSSGVGWSRISSIKIIEVGKST
ncbi:MAG: hypothetical protein HY059_16060 [Proteobacteria bacterium]|nr:hypothetical protein [Pseudomonadota bacterium]